MPDSPLTVLCRYRLDKAGECRNADKELLNDGFYSDSANRSCYAIFHAIRALLALEMKDFKKHSAVISYFQQYYVKTGKLETKFSDYVKQAFSVRQDSDYEDFYLVSIEEAAEQLDHADAFIAAIEDYIKNQDRV